MAAWLLCCTLETAAGMQTGATPIALAVAMQDLVEVNRQLSTDNLRLREQVKSERQQMVVQFQQRLEEQEQKHKEDVERLREQMDESKVCQAALAVPCAHRVLSRTSAIYVSI